MGEDSAIDQMLRLTRRRLGYEQYSHDVYLNMSEHGRKTRIDGYFTVGELDIIVKAFKYVAKEAVIKERTAGFP